MLQQEFENIAASLRHRIVSVARGYGLDADTAEDVAQDAMLKLWTIRAKVASGKQATALGVVIAKHLSVDVLRRAGALDWTASVRLTTNIGSPTNCSKPPKTMIG